MLESFPFLAYLFKWDILIKTVISLHWNQEIKHGKYQNQSSYLEILTGRWSQGQCQMSVYISMVSPTTTEGRWQCLPHRLQPVKHPYAEDTLTGCCPSAGSSTLTTLSKSCCLVHCRPATMSAPILNITLENTLYAHFEATFNITT